MNKIIPTSLFKKDIKKFKHNVKVLAALKSVTEALEKGLQIPKKHKDHILTGNWVEHRECHLLPDVLLIYRMHPGIIFFDRIGNHSELFK